MQCHKKNRKQAQNPYLRKNTWSRTFQNTFKLIKGILLSNPQKQNEFVTAFKHTCLYADLHLKAVCLSRETRAVLTTQPFELIPKSRRIIL